MTMLLAVAAGAQTARTPPRTSLRTWTDPALHLTFSYPAALQPKAAAASAGGGCSTVLLAVGLGIDPNEPGNAAAPPPSATWASLTLSDMGPGCIPARALKKSKMMDQMLSGLASDATQSLGMMPMEQPVGYLLLGHHTFVAAAQGEPVSTDVVQPANGSEVLAVIASHVSDHVFIWRLESNDPNLLNRMLASQVDFGAGTPQALYPGHIGE